MRKTEYSKRFYKDLKRAPLKIKIAFRSKREIFEKNPFDTKLNNHPLSGRLKGLRSINVTGDWRAIYKEVDEKIFFIALGTHSQLYK